MSKKEKFFWSLAYLTTTILIFLPFFQVGFTNMDDFQYYNQAHTSWSNWVADAKSYAHGAGRFYFLITKYFYYVPYLIDNVVWTKLMQYLPLLGCYLLFSYLVYSIFNSQRLGCLTLLALLFNTAIGMDWFYPPTAYPFYFAFSFLIFLAGVLLFVNYAKKGGYWRIIVSSAVFFVSYLFYEDYLVFTVLFVCCVIVWRWRKDGFLKMLKSKQVYLELVPYAAALLLYMACYVCYRHYVINNADVEQIYGGTLISNDFSWSNFFNIIYRCTIYTVPGVIFGINKIKILVAENSLLMSGHYDSFWFVVTHSSIVAYLSALLQCGIFWFLAKKASFKKLSVLDIVLGIVAALVFAFSANILIAISEKYNSDSVANWLEAYVTSFFSYFGVMLALTLLVVLTLKPVTKKVVRGFVCAVWMALLFVFSLNTYYTNEHLGRELRKSQNRVTVLNLLSDENFFEKIPENSLIYTEPLHKTSYVGATICSGSYDFENMISRIAGKKLHYSQTWDDLQSVAKANPERPVYFIQTSESKKYGELLMAFSHITRLGDNVANSMADHADVFYYSPTKDYTLFYNVTTGTESQYKAVNVVSKDKHKKLTHVCLNVANMNPLGFSISNIVVPATETMHLP